MSCDKQLSFFDDALLNRESWAIRLFDNWSKLQSGVLLGNVRNHGIFTECVRFRHESSSPEVGLIAGQHCTVSIQSISDGVWNKGGNFSWADIGNLVRNNNLRLQNGICLPASCSISEVLNYTNRILDKGGLRASTASCQTKEQMTLSALDLVAISVFSVLLIAIVASTVFDLIIRSRPYEPAKIFTSFSLYSNVRDLVKLEPKSTKSIECFHGLRALSAFWVIAGHRVFRHDRMVSRPMKIEGFLSQAVIAVLMTNGYAVDTFFLISGVLIAQSCLRSLNAGNFNLIKIYFNRYMRYIPTVALLLLFFSSSFQFLLVDGPSIGFLERQVEICHKYWWSSLLLIQTYVNVETICMGVTWYLSADFHLFLLSPLFIYLLWKFGYRVLWLFIAIIVVTQTSIFFLRYNDTVSEHIIYRQTHYRIAQFLVGIALGYIMYEREGKHHMRRRSQILGWAISLGVFVAIEIFHETQKNQRFPEAFYSSVHRISFACFMSWLIYSCHHLKSTKCINWFLSQPLWQPIARISLSIYLIHDIYIVLSVANQKELWYFETSWLIHIIIGDITISSILGACLHLIIEAPSNVMLKYLMR